MIYGSRKTRTTLRKRGEKKREGGGVAIETGGLHRPAIKISPSTRAKRHGQDAHATEDMGETPMLHLAKVLHNSKQRGRPQGSPYTAIMGRMPMPQNMAGTAML